MLMLQKFRSCSAQVEKDRERIENSLLAGGVRHVRLRRQNLTRERKDFRQLRRPN